MGRANRRPARICRVWARRWSRPVGSGDGLLTRPFDGRYRAKVDALGRQPHALAHRGARAQGTADLLRAPPLGQPVDDERAQLGVTGELRLFGSPASLRGEDLGVERAVLPSGVEIAAQLTADRRSGPAQRLSNHGRTITPAGQVSDPDPFLLRGTGWRSDERRAVPTVARMARSGRPFGDTTSATTRTS